MSRVAGAIAIAEVSLALVSCSASPTVAPSSTSPPGAPSSSGASAPTPSATDPATDLAAIDDAVRHTHTNAFAVIPEADWTKHLDDVKARFGSMTPDQRVVAMAGLAGLLDTHTQFYPTSNERIFNAYLYRFPEGLYVVTADDPSLVGSRLLAVDGTPIGKIEPKIRALIPADNESARDNNIWVLGYPDYLHGLGIIDDKQKAAFDVVGLNGRRRTVTVTNVDNGQFGSAHHIEGSLAGTGTEAVRRRQEKVWSRLDKRDHAFLLSLNDYTSDGVDAALAAMAAALRSRAATHVVVDMRYLRGGDPSPFFAIVSALAADPHLRTKESLTVLIGRENESAGTVMAEAFDTQTPARLVGEPTPARADNFLCSCTDVPLPVSGYTFSVPTSRAGNGDTRDAVVPDVVMRMTAADYFAGRDKVLTAALTGTLPH